MAKIQNTRMSDIKVGQVFKLIKGGNRQRVTMKNGHSNDIYVLNPITHEVDHVPLYQAWDTTVQVEIPSRWTQDVFAEHYFLNDDPNGHGPNSWRLYYNHTQNSWYLRKSHEQRWINKDFSFAYFDEAEAWANKIVDETENA